MSAKQTLTKLEEGRSYLKILNTKLTLSNKQPLYKDTWTGIAPTKLYWLHFIYKNIQK